MSVNFQKPYATFDGPFRAGITGLTIKMDVGAVGTAEVKYIDGGGKQVVQLGGAQAMAQAQRLQQLRFSERLTPDTVIKSNDNAATGTPLEFRGFLSAPGVDGGRFSYNESATVVGWDAILNVLDFSIYRVAGYEEAREETDGLRGMPKPAGGNITSYLAAASKVLFENFDQSVSRVQSSSMRRLIEQQHTINAAGYIQWLAILNNSSVVFETWAAAMETYPQIRVQLANRVADLLRHKASGFWPTLNALCEEFRMVYVPSADGPGKLVSMLDRAATEVSMGLDLPAENLWFHDGSGQLLPLGAVAVISSQSGLERAETGNAETPEELQARAGIAAIWPSTPLPGYVHRMSPPLWVMDPRGGLILNETSAAEEDPRDGTKDYSPGAAVTRDETSRTTLRLYDAVRADALLEEYARIEFEDLRLGPSTCTAELPLSYDVLPGLRVRVNVMSDVAFDAFVSGVYHNFQLQGGKEVDAYTRVSLSHLTYGN